MLIQLTDKVILQPNQINSLKKSLREEVLKTYGHKHHASHGIIKDVSSNIDIIDNSISKTGNEIILLVSFEADVLKPEVGKKYDGVISEFLNGRLGIFVMVGGVLKVFVSRKSLESVGYELGVDCLKRKGAIIDSVVKVEIVSMRFANKQYQCYGKIN